MSEIAAAPPNPVRIATRGSRLALWQAEHVRAALQDLHPDLAVEFVIIKTTGDRFLDAPLAKIGGKGLFIKELEQALLEGRADLAVHSMKDVPVDLPVALHIPVMLPRADPRDALVAPRYASFAALPRGAVIGTSSLRRKSQLAALRPDLVLRDLRGNVPTRLARVEGREFDGIVLAMAGLERLGLAAQATECFPVERMLPAIGQGAIGIECRRGDGAIETLIAPLADRDTADALRAERAVSARLHGSCQVPIAGHAVLAGDEIAIVGLVASLDGREIIRARQAGPRNAAAVLGHDLGEALLEAGADRILAALES